MSSENLSTKNNILFSWRGTEAAEDYVLATYLITTPIDGELAAYGLAKEQSVCTTSMPGINMPADIETFCAKVKSVDALPDPPPNIADPYFLNTTVYGAEHQTESARQYKVVIAYPVLLFGNGLTRLWNNVVGEVHRLGFLTAASLVDISLPHSLATQYPGPRYGVSGLRNRLDIPQRPLFCRSARPANGLDIEAMLTINEQVLGGGFDIVKDDELTYDSQRSPFVERIQRMVDLKHRIEDKTGEKKLYFANVIDDWGSALTMIDQAAQTGVDGVLVSAAAQGLSFISEVAQRTELIVLAHNSCSDVLTRATHWGVHDSVMTRLQRAAGADLVVSPGPFGTQHQSNSVNNAFLAACRDSLGNCAPCMPILQGGKCPAELAQYIDDVGSTDFMIIAATWLDHHPQGISTAARAFRDAWKQLKEQQKL